MDKVIVVKIGGATLGSHDTTIEDIVYLQKQGKQLVVVHGGGKLITGWLSKLGVATKFIQGERVTDRATLEVTTAVLAGLVNKDIVAAINNAGGQAIGISGVDGALIQAGMKDVKLGYVGEVIKVDAALLESLLRDGYVPVIAPLGINTADRPGDSPNVLNINADVVAGEIAAATGAERLIFLTDVAGICNRAGELLPRLSPAEAEALLVSGVASGGMIPKIKACLKALAATEAAYIIDGRLPHALRQEMEGHGGGTIISVFKRGC